MTCQLTHFQLLFGCLAYDLQEFTALSYSIIKSLQLSLVTLVDLVILQDTRLEKE